MSTPIAAFTGDTHLRPNTWAKHPDLHSDAYVSFTQIVDYCLENRLPLIILGDIFDKSRPDSLSVGRFLHAVSRMEEARLAVYAIEGNHDRADPPWFTLHPWVTPAGRFELGGRKFVGMPFQTAGELPEYISHLMSEDTEVDVLLAHQSWLEIQRVGHTDGSFAQIPYACTMLTGDYHVQGEFRGNAADGGLVRAFSPGSTCMQALNEEPVKGFGVLKQDLSVEWVRIETRTKFDVTLQTEEELQQWLDGLDSLGGLAQRPNHPDIRKPILRVRYQDSIPEAYDRITAAVGDDFHLFLEPQRTIITEVIDETATPEGAFDSLLTAVGELSQPGSAVYNGVRRLLEAEDPQQELERMFGEYQQRHAAEARSEQDASRVPPGPVD